MNIHKPMLDYDPADIQKVAVYNEDSIKLFKELEDEGYEVVFWLPWYSISNHFLGIEYFMAKPQSSNQDEEMKKAWLELCNSTSSPFWPPYEEFKRKFQSSAKSCYNCDFYDGEKCINEQLGLVPLEKRAPPYTTVIKEKGCELFQRQGEK